MPQSTVIPQPRCTLTKLDLCKLAMPIFLRSQPRTPPDSQTRTGIAGSVVLPRVAPERPREHHPPQGDDQSVSHTGRL